MRVYYSTTTRTCYVVCEVRKPASKHRHVKRKDGKALGEGDWEAFEDVELETMLQGLALSADEDTGNESEASMDINVHSYTKHRLLVGFTVYMAADCTYIRKTCKW
ncbi:hypothetical protein KIN20_024626 [Parelaphostrongylus tenuis]|uniref:Uncharacterized protein n=1 Tax=Parelaphostrongylus tenuis TaxID=148309 RepID=A0AAD5MTR7_PARTN|nr:hypothetical protein KIN20_024626 [Parelaphostrongylus tenuis]